MKDNKKKEKVNKYSGQILEQYKIYLQMVDNISNRRQSANSFFLTVNTAIIALISYVSMGSKEPLKYYWLIALAGLVICYTWYRLIRSYKDLNSAKFKVIHKMEAYLPFAPYDTEWKMVGEGKNRKLYLPFTHIEIYIPWIFFCIHLFVLLNLLPWTHIFQLICQFS